jgi:hypothetical protein
VSADVVAEIASQARTIFRQLDRALGELVREAGSEVVTFVVSDHGFGPAPERFVYVKPLARGPWLAAPPGRLALATAARPAAPEEPPLAVRHRRKRLRRLAADAGVVRGHGDTERRRVR